MTDFGLSSAKILDKKNRRKSSIRFDHANEYSSPEIFIDNTYDENSDFWSFGVLLFEILTGELPFIAESKNGLFEKVSKGKYRKELVHNTDFVDFFNSIFQSDITKRLGNSGVEEIQKHQIFNNINWNEDQ